MLYLVCYDIVQDSRRNKVAKLLEAYGLRVQKSVFEVMAEEAEYLKLQRRLQKLINEEEDQLRFYPLTERTRKQVLILGLQPEFSVDDPAFVI
ncbi:MAG: CRISPR-associated endonuclease Cas2 [Spirulinaceae cyanobacterium]